MRLRLHGILALTVFTCAQALENPAATDPSAKASEPTPAPLPKPAIPSREELEKRFADALTNSVLHGTWQMTGEGGLTGKAPLTESKPEKYTITKVTKAYEDYWLIHARIEFGDKDVTFPVPVRVVWAEDTPIITVNDVGIPGIGTYSARVMVFADFYAGTWYSSAKNYGGVLSGRVLREVPKSAPVNEAPK